MNAPAQTMHPLDAPLAQDHRAAQAVTFHNISVRMNEAHTIHRTVPPWEAKVLAAVHGEESVKLLGETVVDRDPPDAAAEFHRLSSKYGTMLGPDGQDTGIAHVAAVYGQHGQGVHALAREIAGCVVNRTKRQAAA